MTSRRTDWRGVLIVATVLQVSACAKGHEGFATARDGGPADAAPADASGDAAPEDAAPEDAALATDAAARDAALDGAPDATPADTGPIDPCAGVSCTGGRACVDGSCLNPDADGDGYRAHEADCDDSNPSIHPGAVETCDGVDQDCDGLVDEGGVCGPPPSPTRATATGLGSGSPDTGLNPSVRVVSGDMGDLRVQPYVSISGGFEWGLSCTHGGRSSCTIDCSGPSLGTYTPGPADCFSDDEEWTARCTLTVECP